MAENIHAAAQSRNEAILRRILGEDIQMQEPRSRIEKLLLRILGEDVTTEKPQSRIEELLTEIVDRGGTAPALEVEALSVSENGTYKAPEGTAYDPVTVNVSGASIQEKKTDILHVSEDATVTIKPDNGFDAISEVELDIYMTVPRVYGAVRSFNESSGTVTYDFGRPVDYCAVGQFPITRRYVLMLHFGDPWIYDMANGQRIANGHYTGTGYYFDVDPETIDINELPSNLVAVTPD